VFIRRVARALRRNTILILVCLAVALGGAYVLTEQETPRYESTVRVVVSAAAAPADGAESDGDESDGAGVGAGPISEERATTYAEVVTSQVLASRVASSLLGDPAYRGESDLDGDVLLEQVSARAVPGSAVLEIRVTDPDPAAAQVIAQTFAEELIATATDIETGGLGTTEDPGFTVIDFASFDDEPVSPQPLTALLVAAGGGLLLGLILTGLREALMTSVRTGDEVTALVDAPVLATIAYESPASRRKLVTELDQHSPRVEGFRALRTGVQFADPDAAHKLIAVTSCQAEEGKSSTAVNLALTLSRAGVRTLLVDGDLRRPQVADTFDIDGSAGVTTVLLGKVDLADAIWTHPDSGLAVLPSGVVPPNPAELLQTQAMSQLLERVRADHEVVIVDCAPLNPVTDAALLAARADGVLLVVRHARTTKDQLRSAVERLRQVGAAPMGVVMNAVPLRRRDSATYGGYQRYDARAKPKKSSRKVG